MFGQINLGNTTGGTLALGGQLRIVSDTTLSGPGSVIMSGNAQIGSDGNGYNLTNQSTIQGSGVIGSNVGVLYPNLNLNNGALVNANSSGNTLSIQGTGNTTNTGTLEATAGGILNLATNSAIDNQGGNITATGTGSTVNVSTSLQGGTLNTSSGGVMQSAASGAELDGLTHGAVTISNGSTYTAGAGTQTVLAGTINLGTTAAGTLALGGNIQLVSSTTLSGPGSLTLSGAAQIGTNGNGYLLTNNATIQGNGLIGSNSGTLYPNGSLTNNGTIIANGGTLSLAGNGTFTNTGVMQANNGSTLHSSSSFSTSTFSGTTLLTGTYNVYDGGNGATIQIDGLGSTGGEVVNNAATILLSGANSNFVDASGLDALSKFADNSGSFTIENGRDVTTPGAFDNSGIMDIGLESLFSSNGGSSDYTQAGGSTLLDGTLVDVLTNIDAGLLDGTGQITGNLTVGAQGEVAPGDTNADGTLTVTGNYIQTGNLVLNLSSPSAYDVLDIEGSADFGGTLTVDANFALAAGETFYLVDYGSRLDASTFSSVDLTGLNLAPGLTAQIVYDASRLADPAVELEINGSVAPSATPEPGTWLMLASALGAIAAVRIIRNRKEKREAACE